MAPIDIAALLVFLGMVFYVSIRIRKFVTYLRENGLKGIGATAIVLGILVFALSIQTLFPLPPETVITNSMYLVVAGAVLIILDWILGRFRKKELLGLEEERREYITRVRKGIKIEDAERIAIDTIRKNVSGAKKPKVISSDKEFKNWTVFLKDDNDNKSGRKYRVVLDIEGEVVSWETLDQLPSYLGGTN